jgi:DNA-directed RNA polymerase specialized sigma24 family protein
MDRKTKQWVARTAAKHYWRVASYYDMDDLIQDAMLVYHRTLIRYNESGRHAAQERTQTKAYMVNTFKRCYLNHIHDLANKTSREPSTCFLEDLIPPASDGEYLANNILPKFQEQQTFATYLSRAPVKVREVLRLFASDDGCERMRVPYRVRPDGARETLNERLCRLAGFDPQRVDLVEHLQQYLSE